MVRADLALTASVDPAAGNVGDLVSFVLNASNLGPDSATNVRVGGSTASGLQLISAMAAGFDCSVDGSSFSCVGATLASGANASVVVGAQIDGAPGSSALLSANVSSTVADPISDNNLAQASVSILAPTGADLSLTKTDSVDPVDAGQQFSYTLTVSNLGPASATGVRIVDPLPAGLTLVSASAPGMSPNMAAFTRNENCGACAARAKRLSMSPSRIGAGSVRWNVRPSRSGAATR